MRERRRLPVVDLLLYAVVAALPVAISLAALHGWLGRGLSDYVPVLSDEVSYWHQIVTFSRVGFGNGYYTYQEHLAPALSPYGFWGPVLPMLYGGVVAVVGVSLTVVLKMNMTLLAITIFGTLLLTRPDRRRLLVVGLVLATCTPLEYYLLSGMQEPLHFSFAVLFAGLFDRLLRAEPGRRARPAVWLIAAITIAGLIRAPWALLLFPVALLTFGTAPPKTTAKDTAAPETTTTRSAATDTAAKDTAAPETTTTRSAATGTATKDTPAVKTATTGSAATDTAATKTVARRAMRTAAATAAAALGAAALGLLFSLWSAPFPYDNLDRIRVAPTPGAKGKLLIANVTTNLHKLATLRTAYFQTSVTQRCQAIAVLFVAIVLLCWAWRRRDRHAGELALVCGLAVALPFGLVMAMYDVGAGTRFLGSNLLFVGVLVGLSARARAALVLPLLLVLSNVLTLGAFRNDVRTSTRFNYDSGATPAAIAAFNAQLAGRVVYRPDAGRWCNTILLATDHGLFYQVLGIPPGIGVGLDLTHRFDGPLRSGYVLATDDVRAKLPGAGATLVPIGQTAEGTLYRNPACAD